MQGFVMHYFKGLATSLTAVFMAGVPLMSAQAATFTAQEQANMKLVADFYVANDELAASGDVTRIRGIAEKYIGEGYIQHMAAGKVFGNGRENFIRMAESGPRLPARPPGSAPPQPAKVLALWANGDLVVRVSSRPSRDGGSPSVLFNMFRVENGKLVEHWDSSSADMNMKPGAGTAGPAPSDKPN